ncbi:MAG: diguanylate cyclase [Campylobacterota bacterium]
MNKEILRNISVLYVEDENDVRQFTAKLLGSLVKNVYDAQNGLEGLNIFEEHQDKIDLVVTDINMPKMDGLEMCSKIREHNKDIPIVITSAHNDPNFLKRAIDVGVNTYAMKPIDLYQLVESMIKAIEPILLKKELEQLNISLETRVEQEIKKVKSILDAQDNIVILTNKETITNVNKRFLEFFEVNTLEEFSNKIDNIYELFKEEYGFITKSLLSKQKCWIEYIKNLPEIDRVVKIKPNSKEQERVFTVNVDNYDLKDNYFVISLTDITELKEKSNLLEYQATHDSLTGLNNRNKFNEIFEKEIRRGFRYDNDLSLIIFDLDRFKDVNDEYGHQVGDEVLKDITQIVLASVREHDFVVRWGGEEFLILLPETDSMGAQKVANKVRKAIENKKVSSKDVQITSSFGVSTLKLDDDQNRLLRRADKALYQAKNQGRNKVVAL